VVPVAAFRAFWTERFTMAEIQVMVHAASGADVVRFSVRKFCRLLSSPDADRY
jgi:hypothetical protein